MCDALRFIYVYLNLLQFIQYAQAQNQLIPLESNAYLLFYSFCLSAFIIFNFILLHYQKFYLCINRPLFTSNISFYWSNDSFEIEQN